MLKKNVLRYRKDFDAVYKKGKSAGSRHLVILYKRNGKELSRISFLASKKVGNSVARNRARRLMKEAYRTRRPDLVIKEGYDLVVIARTGIEGAKMQEVRRSLEKALEKTGVVR